MQVQVVDISGWNIKEWLNTTGTREKCFVENPADGKLYFFKESIDKYPSEFWSEVIASKFGQQLGFLLLDYNIALLNEKAGCICEHMIDIENEELIHGINLVKNKVKNFVITDRPIVSFQHVEQALQPYGGFIYEFIEIMIFDSIIGNQDRHSENWAIVRSLDNLYLEQNKSRLRKYIIEFYKSIFKTNKWIPFRKFYEMQFDELAIFNYTFSKIYDSGSSLGREISEENIPAFLSSKERIEKYIKRGISEIRWNDKKINHFDLLMKIMFSYKEHLNIRFSEVITKYNSAALEGMIQNIDKDLPSRYQQNKLSLQRKQLIFALIDSRIHFLKQLFIQ